MPCFAPAKTKHASLSQEIQNDLLKRINALSLQSGVASLAAIIASGRTVASTAEAANSLGYKSQTMRRWACYDSGPIRPVRVGGHLRWKITDIVALLEGGLK